MSYQVEVAPNVICERHIDQLLASENNRDFQLATDIPALANVSSAAGETPVDMQDQQENPKPDAWLRLCAKLDLVFETFTWSHRFSFRTVQCYIIDLVNIDFN